MQVMNFALIVALAIAHFVFRYKVLKTFKYFTSVLKNHHIEHSQLKTENKEIWKEIMQIDANQYIEDHKEE